MAMRNYLKGKGIDVSREKHLNNTPHYFAEPNNFYSLKKFCDYESQDFIYSKELINETKFFRILIKEWMNFCKVGGHIIIEMSSNKLLRFNDLIGECGLLIDGKGKIVGNEYSAENNKGIVVIKKTAPILKKGDSIDKWTFGIITGGVTDAQVDKGISSILALNVPNYEIIICGVYAGKYLKNKKLRYLKLDVPIPWITKKKNMICEKAKYENLVIMHDHFHLRKDWYNGMKKYGNYFEVLSCRIYDPKGRRAQDWITYGIPLSHFSKDSFKGAGGNLEYQDWDKNVNIGGFAILKRSAWEKCPWDERLLLFQAEDMKLSWDFYKNGIVARFNPYSSAETKKEEWGDYQLCYRFHSKKLGKPTGLSLKMWLRYYIKNFLYNQFGVYIKKADAHDETKRIFAVPMKSAKKK